MKQPQVFQSDQFGAVRVLYEDGKPLFCGADACRALGYKDPTNAIKRHCKGVAKRHTLTNGGKQQMSFLPEGDLYRLICHSKLPSAEQFERWVFEEVLPTLRREGAYSTRQQQAYTAYLEDRDRRLNDQIAALAAQRKNLRKCITLLDEIHATRDKAKADYLQAKARYGKYCDLSRQGEALVRSTQADVDACISALEQSAASPDIFDEVIALALPALMANK